VGGRRRGLRKNEGERKLENAHRARTGMEMRHLGGFFVAKIEGRGKMEEGWRGERGAAINNSQERETRKEKGGLTNPA